MPDLSPLPRSALAGIAQPGRHGRAAGAPGVTIAVIDTLAEATIIARKGRTAAASAAALKAFGAALPKTPSFIAAKAVTFFWTGPGQWWAQARTTATTGLEKDLTTALGDTAAVTDQTGGRVILRLTGPRARDVLAKGVPIDLHPARFAPGDAAVTLAGHVGIALALLDEAPTFELAVSRSWAASLWRWLAASAGEYGYEVKTAD